MGFEARLVSNALKRPAVAVGSHPTDVRMTTRFKPDDLTEGLTGAIHETGHALYEQNRNLKYDGLPVNQVSMNVCWPLQDDPLLFGQNFFSWSPSLQTGSS